MNFALFDSMSLDEARDHLNGFLESERLALESMRPAAEEAGVVMDYSLSSLPHVLKWILKRVRFVRVPLPASEPEWIRQAHPEGIIEFNEESKYLILRCAYYMGECFVRSHPALRWATGDPEYIEKNMPVVAGFTSDKEMATMMIVKNVFTRILGYNAPITDIDRALNTWTGYLPSSRGGAPLD
jgi:hypothetical protein